MITLCGFPLSNYYNKVKMALLEKGLPFTEERVKTHSDDEAVLAASPLAKVPFIRTEHGAMCESQAIVDYLEKAYPAPALLPADPWAAGKVRELGIFIDLHLELVARELYPQAFFGGTVSDGNKARVRKPIARPSSACRWWRWPRRSSTARTCSPPRASTGRATSSSSASARVRRR